MGHLASDGARLGARGLVYPRITVEESKPERIACLRELDRTPRAHVVALPGGLRVKRHTPGPDKLSIAGGGARGVVRGFSQDSRRRMIARLQGIAWSRQPVLFVTLTFPGELREQDKDWREQKRALIAWRKRLYYRWPQARGLLWRLELAERKSGASIGQVAAHFHVALFWTAGARVPLAELRAWCAEAWTDIIAGDAAHLAAGTQVLIAKNTRGAQMGKLLSYLSKYLGKLEARTMVDKDSGEVLSTGRVWGTAGDVPSEVLGAFELTQADFETLCERINAKGKRKSWYLASISPRWAGFQVTGDGELLTLELLDGLAGIELRG